VTVLDPRPAPSRDPLPAPLPGDERITELPVLILFPHSRCNCRCLMCDIWKDRGAREIAPDEVARLGAELAGLGVRRVVLSGGEPLMHSDLRALVSPLLAAGIGLTLLSSGLLLERDAALVAEVCDDLVVSLDGPEEVHDAIRNVPKAFARMKAGIAAVRRHRPDLSVTARCTVQKANFRELRRTVAAARALGADRLSFLAADVRSEAFARPGGWDAARAAQVALSREELPELAAELDALEREVNGGFVVESAEKLRRKLLDYFTALAGLGAFPEVRCNAPWVSSVVESDGTVRPCFFQPPIGNHREAGSLEAVLNSPRALAFRRGLDVATDPICRACVCSLELKRS
jgi:MoaA/NifB/PqqE/SkfB family radical SAM enzyme